MTFADLQFYAPEDDLEIWVGVISLHVKHLLLPQGFDSPCGPIITGVWVELRVNNNIPETFWSSVCHYGLLWENLIQAFSRLDDRPVFVDNPLDFR